MSQTELKMQPTIQLNVARCIVGCLFNSLGLIITLESSCIGKIK
jgi:hypothetical protein